MSSHPYENRTRISRLKIWRPNHLDEWASYRVFCRMIGLTKVSFTLLYLPCCCSLASHIRMKVHLRISLVYFEHQSISSSGAGWIRTTDTCIFSAQCRMHLHSALLYQLSYHPKNNQYIKEQILVDPMAVDAMSHGLQPCAKPLSYESKKKG